MENLALKDIIARMLRQRAGNEPPAPRTTGATTVLIVDDSRTIVHAIRLLLEAAGYATLSASDGQEAVDLARNLQPDLILMDIVMPRMNGFEATRLLMQDPRTAGIPVIIVSGTDQASDRVWGLRLGAKDFLAKPVRKDELLPKVARVLAYTRQTERQKTALQQTGAFDANPPGLK